MAGSGGLLGLRLYLCCWSWRWCGDWRLGMVLWWCRCKNGGGGGYGRGGCDDFWWECIGSSGGGVVVVAAV